MLKLIWLFMPILIKKVGTSNTFVDTSDDLLTLLEEIAAGRKSREEARFKSGT